MCAYTRETRQPTSPCLQRRIRHKEKAMKLRKALNKPMQFLSTPWEQGMQNYFLRNKTYIVLFCVLFVLNLLIYGQRLVGNVLAWEDFMRFLRDAGTQVSVGRWFNGWVGKYVLTKELHILPYFNTVVGVFSFTLAGFLTALLFKQKRPLPIAVVTLLCSTAPYVTHNFFFNTNTIAWITTAWGVLGFYLFCTKKTVLRGAVFFILLVLSIGAYQTIIQVLLAIVLIQSMQRIYGKEKREILQEFLRALFYIVFICVAFFVSSYINVLFIKFNEWHVETKSATLLEWQSLKKYAQNIISSYASFMNLGNIIRYKIQYIILYMLMTIIATGTMLVLFVKERKALKIKILTLIGFVLLIPLIAELPALLGKYTAIRAYFTVSWFIAGFFVFVYEAFEKQQSLYGVLRNSVLFIIGCILTTNVLYANVFFYTVHRQTQSDIIRANQIVSRIRQDPNYKSETTPLKFKIVGEKRFAVTGSRWLPGVLPGWSKYNIFTHFTDLNFVKMSDETFENLENKLAKKEGVYHTYPAQNSIIVNDKNVVLFLDARRINAKIFYQNRERYTPVAQFSEFRMYYQNNLLCYLKENLSEAEKNTPVFLHVVPENAVMLSEQRRAYGYEGRDFLFSELGVRNKANVLFACQTLPSYPIKEIHTGQYVPRTKKQKLAFVMREVNTRRKQARSFGAFWDIIRNIKKDIQTEKIVMPGRMWETRISLK